MSCQCIECVGDRPEPTPEWSDGYVAGLRYAVDLCETMVLYTTLDCADKLREEIELETKP